MRFPGGYPPETEKKKGYHEIYKRLPFPQTCTVLTSGFVELLRYFSIPRLAGQDPVLEMIAQIQVQGGSLRPHRS